MAVNRNPTRGFGRRGAIAALAVAGWVLILVVAAGPRPTEQTWVGLPALDDLMAATFVALVIWAAIWTFRVVRFGPGTKATRSTNLITLWLGLAVAIAVLMVNPSIVERFLQAEPTDTTVSDGVELVEEDSPDPVDFEITANQVYVALAAIGAWLAITAFARRRNRPADAAESLEGLSDQELSRTIEDMVEDLELGSDPRAAVLTAYHRLERTLADRGRSRRPAETPTEHLDRVLSRLPIDQAPFLDLAHRYELARFSDQPITEADRDRATTDLTRARDDLTRLDRR